MSTNANVFNSRVTSEALEAKYRQVFPAQAGAELIQDLYASGVIQPVIDFTTVAEGSVLAPNLQTAWDFSTGSNQVNNSLTTIITNTGFWLVDLTVVAYDLDESPVITKATVDIFDGSSAKPVWGISSTAVGVTSEGVAVAEGKFVVFLRTGDSLRVFSNDTATTVDVWYRQIADVNGNLVNPLGFTFS